MARATGKVSKTTGQMQGKSEDKPGPATKEKAAKAPAKAGIAGKPVSRGKVAAKPVDASKEVASTAVSAPVKTSRGAGKKDAAPVATAKTGSAKPGPQKGEPGKSPAKPASTTGASARGTTGTTSAKAGRGKAAGAGKSTSSKAATAKLEPAGNSRPTSARQSAKSSPAGGAPAARDEKPWLKSYPPNVPAEIGPLQFTSVGDLVVEASKKYAGRPAFTCMDKTITFKELERLSAAFGAYLQARGLLPGARVALMMPNVLQYPVALLGVLRAGYTVVNVNPLYTPRELEHQLNDAGAEAIVILENFATTLQAVVASTGIKHVVVASMGDMLGLRGIVVNLVVRRVKKMVPAWSLPGHVKFPAALKEGAARTFKPARVSGDDIAFLQYTGGTTGISKGAMLLHRNVLSNVAQNALWMQSAFIKKPRPERLTFICALPLYHIYALTVNALMGIQEGGHNILIVNPRDIGSLVKEMQKHPINIFPGLNTLFNALLNNAEFGKLDFSPLLLSFGGGMAVQRSVAERWKRLTGINISEGYGLSETSPVAAANRFDADEFTGSIGLPIPSTEISIRDENNAALPLGEVGELCIRGPQVMAGYWNRPDESAKVMTADGFFKTGDMGFMDEKGFTKIVDRKKDMILVSGFNVYPNELEEVVAQHPGVLEVAAIGVPDEHSGEVPKLFIVKKDPKLTEADIIAFCRENLTGYKRPRHIEFRTELPKTNVGKILRRELRG